MEKRNNEYALTLRLKKYANGENTPEKDLALDFTNHDEIFGVIEVIQAKNLFGDTAQATEFAIGLKLFSEVMIKNRQHPLFEELAPAFNQFMKRLKSS